MEYGLSDLDLAVGDQLEVGTYEGWLLVATVDGVFVRADRSRSVLERLSAPSPTIETHLNALESQGYCMRLDGGYYFTYADLKSLRTDDWKLISSFCEFFPAEIALEHTHNLGHPDFVLSVEFRIGGRRVYPEMLGPFVRLEGDVYLLSEEVRALLDEVRALNQLEADEKAALSRVLSKWAAVDAAADQAEANRDAYLAGEKVVVPEKVRLDVLEDDAGRVSVVPEFEGVDTESTHQAYLRENEIQDVYHLDAGARGRVRVVLTDEVKPALEAIRQYRRLTPKEQDRLFSRPSELIPDEVSADVIDLSLYGPRVRAIGEYPATVRPFTGERRAWSDIGAGDDADTLEVGLSLEFEDGSSSQEVFDRLGEAEELLEKVDAALESDEPVVEFRGKRLRADDGLRDAISDCVDKLNKEDSVEKAPRDDDGQERTRTSIQGPLVYENVEDREYAESDHKVSDNYAFQRPGALRGDVELKPHQEVGVGWLAESVARGKRGALLADDMGLGKTLQALTFLAWMIENDPLRTGLSNPSGPWSPILVVTPVILLEVWREEVKRFFDESVFLPYEILDSTTLRGFRLEQGREGKVRKSVLDLCRLKQHRLIISNYDAVANYGFSFARIPWSAVITDESHQFKEPSTRVAQVMKSLNTQFRVAMTGTPVVNRLLDVWNLVDFLRPLYLGSQKEFRDRFELKPDDGGPPEGARRLKEELKVATEPPVTAESVVLRRSKERELPGLPQKTEKVVECMLSTEQRREYVNLVQSISGQGGKGKMFQLLSGLNKLLQHPAMVGLIPPDSDPKQLMSSGPKLEALVDGLREVRRRGEKALVFAIYCDMQHILKRVLDAEFGLDVRIINGQTSEAGARVRSRRLQLISEFCAKPGFDVMVLSPDVAGVGLTITAANHVFHYGRWWNPAREDQATDRTYRIGQERPVFVYRLVAKDPAGEFRTFDEHLDALIAERRLTADQFLLPAAMEDEVGQTLAGRVFEHPSTATETASTRIDSADDLAALSAEQFEALVACWLSSHVKQVFLTPYAGDAGLDAVGVGEGEVWCVQAKHVQRRGRRVDESAVHQVRNGASHYLTTVLPRSLRSARARITVVTNGRASRRLEAEAERYGVAFVGGAELLKTLRAQSITTADLLRQEAERYGSMRELKASVASSFA